MLRNRNLYLLWKTWMFLFSCLVQRGLVTAVFMCIIIAKWKRRKQWTVLVYKEHSGWFPLRKTNKTTQPHHRFQLTVPCTVCKNELKIQNHETHAGSGKYFKSIKCLKLRTWQQRTRTNIPKAALPFLLLRNNFPDNACPQEKQDSRGRHSWETRARIILILRFKAHRHKRHNKAYLQRKQRETVLPRPLLKIGHGNISKLLT